MAKPLSLFEKYKKIAAEEGKPFKNDDEAWESYRRLEEFADVLLDLALKEVRNKSSDKRGLVSDKH